MQVKVTWSFPMYAVQLTLFSFPKASECHNNMIVKGRPVTFKLPICFPAIYFVFQLTYICKIKVLFQSPYQSDIIELTWSFSKCALQVTFFQFLCFNFMFSEKIKMKKLKCQIYIVIFAYETDRTFFAKQIFN